MKYNMNVKLLIACPFLFCFLSCVNNPEPKTSWGNTSFYNIPNSSDLKTLNDARFIKVDSIDNIWVLAKGQNKSKLYKFNNDQWTNVTQIDGLDTTKYFSCLTLTPNRKIVIAACSSYVVQEDTYWEYTRFGHGQNDDSENYITHMSCNNSKYGGFRLWASNDYVICGFLVHYGGSVPLVTSVFESRRHINGMASFNDTDAYITSDFGLASIMSNEDTVLLNSKYSSILSEKIVADIQKHILWFTVNSNCLVKYFNNKFTEYNFTNTILPNSYITSLAIDSKHKLWISTWNNGLYCCDGDSFSEVINYRDDGKIWAIDVDSKDNVWMFGDGRILKYPQ